MEAGRASGGLWGPLLTRTGGESGPQAQRPLEEQAPPLPALGCVRLGVQALACASLFINRSSPHIQGPPRTQAREQGGSYITWQHIQGHVHLEEIKPLCYETICVGLGLYNTPLAPIIRKSPGAPNPPGPPEADVPTPGAGHARSLTASTHPGGPPAGEAWAVHPGWGLPNAHVRPGWAAPRPERPGRGGLGCPARIPGGVAAVGGGGRAPGQSRQTGPCAPSAGGAGGPHPHPSARGARHLPSSQPLE